MRSCLIFPLSIAMAVLAAKPADAAEPWTLDRLVNRALTVSGRVAAERITATEASLDSRTAAGNRLPQVSLSGSAGYVSKVMEIDMAFRTIQFGDHDSYDATLTVNQILYDGGRLRALEEASDLRSRMGASTVAASQLAVAYTAKIAFFSLAAAQASLAAAEQSLVEAEAHAHDIEALNAQGMALEHDVLKARLRVSTVRMDIVARTGAVERARAALRAVAGIPSDDSLQIALPALAEASSIEHLEPRHRPEFAAYDAAFGATEVSARAAAAGHRPRLGLFGSFSYGRPGLDLPANDWMHYARAGVRLDWNLWDWGAVDREIEKAQLAGNRTLALRDDFARDLDRETTDAWSRYHEARQRLSLAREASAVAQKALELTSTAFRAGSATETDYDTAHAAYTRAAYDLTAAEANVWLGIAAVEYVLGITPGEIDHD